MKRKFWSDQTSVEGAGLQCKACTADNLTQFSSRGSPSPSFSPAAISQLMAGFVYCKSRGALEEIPRQSMQLIQSLSHPFQLGLLDTLFRHDICHKHHKQRLCKIISTRVKFHFGNVLLEPFMYVSFWFLVISSHVNL